MFKFTKTLLVKLQTKILSNMRKKQKINKKDQNCVKCFKDLPKDIILSILVSRFMAYELDQSNQNKLDLKNRFGYFASEKKFFCRKIYMLCSRFTIDNSYNPVFKYAMNELYKRYFTGLNLIEGRKDKRKKYSFLTYFRAKEMTRVAEKENDFKTLCKMAEKERKKTKKKGKKNRSANLRLLEWEKNMKFEKRLEEALCFTLITHLNVRDRKGVDWETNLVMFLNLKSLDVKNCSSFKGEKIPQRVESLFVDNCKSFEMDAKIDLPNNLKFLRVHNCENYSCSKYEVGLKYLNIVGNSKLKKLYLPKTLESLEIKKCENFSEIERCEIKEFVDLPFIKSKPLVTKSSLIFDHSKIQRSNLPRLKTVIIDDCNSFIGIFPHDSIQIMSISNCQLYDVHELPKNLRVLEISNCKNCKVFCSDNLHMFSNNSLKTLKINNKGVVKIVANFKN